MPLNITRNITGCEYSQRREYLCHGFGTCIDSGDSSLENRDLNLMPIKITTETDLIRLLSNSPLQIEIDFLHMESHSSKNTPIEHLMTFYKTF